MKVKCSFKFSPYGKIYDSLYDTETGLIDGIPENMFQTNFNPLTYNILGGFDINMYPSREVERYMFECIDCYLCIDYGSRIFRAFHRDCYVYLVDKNRDFVIDKRLQFGMFGGDWKPIGYIPSPCKQLYTRPYFSELVMNRLTREVLIDNKWYKIPYSDEELTGADPYLRGYKDCVAEKATAVVYINNEPTFMYLRDGELIFKK